MVNHPCPPPHGSSGAAASESSLGVRTPKEAIPEVSISPSPLSPSWPESQASGGLGHRRPSSILPIRCAGPAEDTVALGAATRTRWQETPRRLGPSERAASHVKRLINRKSATQLRGRE